MTSRLFVVTSRSVGGIACQSDRPGVDRARKEVSDAARTAQKEAGSARAALNWRLDQLDNELDGLDARADKATGKAKAKLKEQAGESRAEGRNLRDRISTWDDNSESAWRTTKRELYGGLDKTGNAIKKLVDDIKD